MEDFKKIITLNFDKVLRASCDDTAVIDFDYTQAAQLANFLKNNDERSYIWHLHGRIDNFPALVFTSDSYKALYSTETAFQASLMSFRSICATKNLLFVGCSLSDAEILAELANVADIFQDNVGPHFALVHAEQVEQVREKLKDLPLEVISFKDFGQPLVEIVDHIALSQEASKPRLIPATSTNSNKRIAVLVANPIDRRYPDIGLLKEIKKLKSEIHLLPLNIENLNSLSGYQYVFILTGVQRGRIIIEDEWIGSSRIGIDELIDNISDPQLSGIFVFADGLEFDQESLDNCVRFSTPVALYPVLDKSLLSSIFFKILKKGVVQLTPDTVVINKDNFLLELPSGISKEVYLGSPLSDAIDPRAIKRFVGRKDDLKIICKRILEGRNSGDIITIKGAGGIGKTLLAKACAVEFSTRGLFAEGIFFVDCEFISDYVSLEQQLARIFDFEQCVNFKAEIKNHRGFCDLLIILDNAESLLLLADAEDIKNLIDVVADYSTILITTRELLETEKEVSQEVRQLTSDEALELFKQELGNRVLVAEEEQFVRERIIEELLDNNPLAIKLITRNTPSGKDFRYLHKELTEDVFGKIRDVDEEIFSSKSDRNVERKKSIYASINYSYSRLSEKEKSSFEILSLFPAGINMENFKRVCAESKGSRKRDSKQHNNPVNQFIVTDSVIKSLESKSVIEIDNNIVCLQSLVGRFAEYQFSKKSVADIRRLRKNAYYYQSAFAEALAGMLNKDNQHALVAKKMYWHYQKNFIKCAGYLNEIDITADEICSFINDISTLCFNTCAYSSLLKVLDEVDFNFDTGSVHERVIRMVYLSLKYFNGEFEEAAEEVKKEFPLQELATLDSGSSLVRSMVSDALNIFAMEGHVLETLPLMPIFVKSYEGYPDILHMVGEFDIDLIKKCRTDFFTFEAKLACGNLNLEEIDSYIKSLHKQEHLERMQSNYTRAKLVGATYTEIDRLVVINPYTSGIKSLIQAIVENESDAVENNFKDAIKNLFSIKFYYVEAHYFYARYLFESHRNLDFVRIKNYGMELALSHGYRYLYFLFNQIGSEIVDVYDKSCHLLTEESLAAIESIIAQGRKGA